MSSPNFCNFNALTKKSYCVFCLKGLPPIKKDAYYSTDTKKWYRQYHKGGSCAEDRDFCRDFNSDAYYKRLDENKLLITRAINNNKSPLQQKRLDDKKSKQK